MTDVTLSLELPSDIQQIFRDHPHNAIATTALLADLRARFRAAHCVHHGDRVNPAIATAGRKG